MTKANKGEERTLTILHNHRQPRGVMSHPRRFDIESDYTTQKLLGPRHKICGIVGPLSVG